MDEIRQHLQCLCPCDGPAKLLQAAWVVGKSRVHQRHHFTGNVVWLKSAGRWQFARSGFANTAAIVSIKIPLTADGLITLHQDVMFASEFAVEIFKTQAFTALRMRFEFANGAQEMVVVPNV